MPDGRIAQFLMGAKLIDERPDIVVGTMGGMVVLQAEQVNDGGQKAIRYVVWHHNLPHMPLQAVKVGENVQASIPWITCQVNNDPENPSSGRYRYEWEMLEGKFRKIVLRGEYTLVGEPEKIPEPPPANQNKEEKTDE